MCGRWQTISSYSCQECNWNKCEDCFKEIVIRRNDTRHYMRKEGQIDRVWINPSGFRSTKDTSNSALIEDNKLIDKKNKYREKVIEHLIQKYFEFLAVQQRKDGVKEEDIIQNIALKETDCPPLDFVEEQPFEEPEVSEGSEGSEEIEGVSYLTNSVKEMISKKKQDGENLPTTILSMIFEKEKGEEEEEGYVMLDEQ